MDVALPDNAVLSRIPSVPAHALCRRKLHPFHHTAAHYPATLFARAHACTLLLTNLRPYCYAAVDAATTTLHSTTPDTVAARYAATNIQDGRYLVRIPFTRARATPLYARATVERVLRLRLPAHPPQVAAALPVSHPHLPTAFSYRHLPYTRTG